VGLFCFRASVCLASQGGQGDRGGQAELVVGQGAGGGGFAVLLGELDVDLGPVKAFAGGRAQGGGPGHGAGLDLQVQGRLEDVGLEGLGGEGVEVGGEPLAGSLEVGLAGLFVKAPDRLRGVGEQAGDDAGRAGLVGGVGWGGGAAGQAEQGEGQKSEAGV